MLLEKKKDAVGAEEGNGDLKSMNHQRTLSCPFLLRLLLTFDRVLQLITYKIHYFLTNGRKERLR